MLSQKYALDSKVRPFVGDAHASFHSGPVQIYLDAPHMSFDMNLVYATDAFVKTMHAKQLRQREARKAQTANQL